MGEANHEGDEKGLEKLKPVECNTLRLKKGALSKNNELVKEAKRI